MERKQPSSSSSIDDEDYETRVDPDERTVDTKEQLDLVDKILSKKSGNKEETKSENKEKQSNKKRKRSTIEKPQKRTKYEETPIDVESLRNGRTVHVKNIPSKMKKSEIKALFSKFGKITLLHFPLNDEGQSKGFAYVEYEKEGCAKKAAQKLNDYELKKYKRPLSVELKARVQIAKPAEVMITNLSLFVTDEQLKEECEKYGKVLSVNRPYHLDTKKPRNFGFVAFETEEEAQRAVEGLNGMELAERVISARLAANEKHAGRVYRIEGRNVSQPKEVGELKSKTIFLRNLNFKTTEKTLKKRFEEFGRINNIRIPVFSDSGKSRGIAYIKFASVEAAEKAVQNGEMEIDDRKVQITFSFK